MTRKAMSVLFLSIAGIAASSCAVGTDSPSGDWKRCSSVTFAAHPVGGKPALIASGTVPTGGWQEKVQMSPELIQPPRYEALCLKPSGIVTQVITHYEVTAALPEHTKEGDVIQVYDAEGLQSVSYSASAK